MSEKIAQAPLIQSIYEAAVEVLGKSDALPIISAITNWDGIGEIQDIDDKSQFLANLGNEFSIRYERNTSKGLLLRIGESSFAFLHKKIQALMELGNIENRLIPISKRFDLSLGILAENLSLLTGLEIGSNKKSINSFCLEIGRKNKGLFSSNLHLFYFAGLLRAFCVWLDSRKEYSIVVNEEDQGGADGKFVCFRFEDIAP